jgi:hypothetical protein
MPEPVATHPDPAATTTRPDSSPDRAVPPMPFTSPDRAVAPMPFTSPDSAVPPMPSEVTNGHDRTQRTATGGWWHKMTRRTPRGAA